MKETKLLNCPFCGGEAELDCDDHFSNWFVRCTKCFCKTPKHITEFFAKVCWNTRKPMERIMERLDEKVNFVDGKITQKINWGHQVEPDQQFMNGVMYAAIIVKEEGLA